MPVPDKGEPRESIEGRFASRVAGVRLTESLFDGLLRQVEDPAALVRLHARAQNPEHREKLAAELRRRGIEIR